MSLYTIVDHASYKSFPAPRRRLRLIAKSSSAAGHWAPLLQAASAAPQPTASKASKASKALRHCPERS